MNWQPIKSLPKDKVYLVGYYEDVDWYFDTAWWEPLAKRFVCDLDGSGEVVEMGTEFTHWAAVNPPAR